MQNGSTIIESFHLKCLLYTLFFLVAFQRYARTVKLSGILRVEQYLFLHLQYNSVVMNKVWESYL